MIDEAKLTLVTAVLVAGFAAPVLADCLESGAAESCGGGSYPQALPDSPSYYGEFPGYRPYATHEEFGRL
jgi:hypothetical protein